MEFQLKKRKISSPLCTVRFHSSNPAGKSNCRRPLRAVKLKRPNVETIRDATLFYMEKLEVGNYNLVNKLKVERPSFESEIYPCTSVFPST
jgi:hypothetical protein